jgi:hypothetical protein
VVGFVRAAKGVPDVEVASKVADVVRVVIVVVACTGSERHHFEWVPGECVAGVSLDGLQNVGKKPSYRSGNVHPWA